MINVTSYMNSMSDFSKVETPSSNSTEDILSLIRALRNDRSEDIQDKIIDNLHNKKTKKE